MDEEPERAKRWEGGYERTWEILKEDESGSLKATVEEILFQAKRKRVFESHGQVRLGMMRHLYVVIDTSRTMEDQDLKPNRLTSTLKNLVPPMVSSSGGHHHHKEQESGEAH
uniref:General transcription factor IIH, polypeptide 2 n=1 Tax=Oncorhynchus mykiss TaxID=8022 RepID=A0A8C7Q637_ONCMY